MPLRPRYCSFFALSLLTCLAVACADDGDLMADDDAGMSETDTATTTDDAGTTETGDTGGEQLDCAPDDLEACPEGSKCTALLPDDDTGVNYSCVMDAGDLLPGETCFPDPVTGVDGCPSGYACIPDTELTPTEGHCLELCLDDTSCVEGVCVSPPASPIPVCATLCNPAVQNCTEPQVCRRVETRAFACEIPLPSDIGLAGDPCDGENDLGCAPGFVCEPSAELLDCEDDYCCTNVCEVGGEPVCDEMLMCEELELESQLDSPTIGACRFP